MTKAGASRRNCKHGKKHGGEGSERSLSTDRCRHKRFGGICQQKGEGVKTVQG